MMPENTTSDHQNDLQDGYDLPIEGLGNGQFYSLHISALSCIFVSLSCAIAVVITSFRLQSVRTFFSWAKSERFVVYLALCDGLFNVAHSLDHAHILISKTHVYPKQLCEFYGFVLVEFITAQTLMVKLVAINAFMLMYFSINIDFGKNDWKILLYAFGLPFVIATIAGSLSTLGPNGTVCFFDGVKGEVAYVTLATVPLLLVLAANVVLYSLTWYRLSRQAKRLKCALGKDSASMRASHQATRNMTLFVLVYFIQWWAAALYGIWQLASSTIPFAITLLAITFTNIGGLLNGIVFIVIRRRKFFSSKESAGEGVSRSGTHARHVCSKKVELNTLENVCKSNTLVEVGNE